MRDDFTKVGSRKGELPVISEDEMPWGWETADLETEEKDERWDLV